MKITDYRMCDVDGCSTTENLIKYEGDHDLCQYHAYLAKRSGLVPEEGSKMILFFDTETTGVPRNYKAPASDAENWPRLVQLGFIVMDDKNVLLETEYVVFPSFEIPAEASRVHGITTEKAKEIGQPIGDILGNFKFWVENCDLIVGHNVDFDVHVAGAEFHRLFGADPFEGKKIVDTMKSSTSFCQIPNGRGSYKWPKLHELYRKLFEQDMGAAHTALQDIQNTAKCYFELVERGILKP